MLVLVKTPDIGSLFIPFNNLLYVLLQLLLLEGHTADKLLLLRMCPLEIKSIYIYIYYSQSLCHNVIRHTYFFPSSSGSRPCTIAARPVAPAPSTTAFSNSSSRRIDIAMFSSLKYEQSVSFLHET